MANQIRGITIQLGADTQPLNRALEDVNRRSRDLQGELRQVDRLLRLDPNNVELTAQRQQLLTEAVENTTDRLETLREAERQVQQQFERGEVGAEQYRAIQREVIAAEQNLQNLESQLTETNTRWRDMSSNMQNAGNKMKDIGGSMSAKVTTPIVAGLTVAVEGTREFREELARLETNAQMAGADVDKTKEALRDLGELSDDSGANVEALSNLLQAGFKNDSLASLVNELSGAVIKFPDTLKIEGLSDGLQETLATGEAIGPFSELLERMGVDLESFNKGLANASKTGEEHNYVLQELSKLGLAEVNEAYRENNSTMIENAEAQNRLKEATAELGELLEPILTTVKEVLAEVIERFLELSPEMQRNIGIAVALVAAIGPLLMIVGQISLGLSALIGLFGGTAAATAGATAATAGATTATGGLSAVITAITGPIGIAIAAIVGITAIIIALWKTNEEFRDNVMIIWEQIKEIFNLALNKIKEVVTTIYNNILEFWKQNGEQIMSIAQNLWDTVGNIFNAALTIIQGLLDVFIGLFTGDWERFGKGLTNIFIGVWETIKSIISGAWELISGAFGLLKDNITDWFEGLVDGAKDWGANLIDGFIDGIKSMIGNVKDTVSGVVNTVSDYMGFNSPSKKGQGRHIVDWGYNMVDGFMEGMNKALPELRESLNTAIPNMNNITNNTVNNNIDLGVLSSATKPINLVLDGRVVSRVLAPIINQEINIDATNDLLGKGAY